MAETDEYTFSNVGGALCLDFANTISSHHTESPNEHLNSYGDLLKWGRQQGVLSEEEAHNLGEQAERQPNDADEVLLSARKLRRTMYMIFSAVATDQPARPTHLRTLNRYIARALSHARVVDEGPGFTWGWADLEGHLDRMLWPVARSAADLLTSGQVERVRECGGHDCGWLFVDTSKNHSRRWCDMNDCGNRAKAHRYYKRQKVQLLGAEK